MITVTNYFTREGKDGSPFVVLELNGDIEMVQSLQTGRFYATAKKCTISSTFPAEIAKTFLGKKLKGRIDRVECEPYEYLVPGTKEAIILGHTYVYVPQEISQTIDDKPTQRDAIEA